MTNFWRPDRGATGVALVRWGAGWREFRDPIETRTADTVDDVNSLLEWAEERAQANYVVGFVAFDAAPAMDIFSVVPGTTVPLARFAVYESGRDFSYLTHGSLEDFGVGLRNPVPKYGYNKDIGRIKAMLREGRTYQINHTFRLVGEFTGEVGDMFCALCEAHVPEHGALLLYEDLAILSLSPELFFQREGKAVISQPMKGTRPISRSPEELKNSEKDRAENLMIVDMIRNDLGRVAVGGSVQVPTLFEVRPHGSVWQMTSTVTAQVTESTASIFRSLFPCASVVGAPKIEATKAISELERSPRGIYCGAIGWMAPEKQARFSVAIRTLVLQGTRAEYGVGGGIVWDSNAQDEWAECHAKSLALEPLAAPELLETAIWGGEHLSYEEERRMRMAISAQELEWEPPQWNIGDFGQPPLMVRLCCRASGDFRSSGGPYAPFLRSPTYAICPWPVDSKAAKLRYKTTRRALYDRAHRDCPNADQVLLWNERGEVTEFTTGNVVVKLAGKLLTPPVASGLLPGLARAQAMTDGMIHEQVITVGDLAQVDEVWHVNSVRGWTRIYAMTLSK